MRRLGLVAVALLVLLTAVYLLRGILLDRPLLGVASWAADRFASIELEAEDIDFNWRNQLRLEGVRASSSAEDGPVKNLTAAEVDLSFAWGGLLQGGLSGVRKITVRDLVADLDLRPSEEPQDDAPPPALPARLPALDLQGLRLSLDLAEGTRLDFTGDRLAVEAEGGRDRIALDLPRVEIDAPEVDPQPFPLEGALFYEGGLFTVESLQAGATTVEEGGRIDLRGLPEETITADLALRSPHGQGSLEARLQAGAVEVSARGEEVSLGPIAAWLRSPALEGIEGQVVSFEGGVDLPPEGFPAGSGRLEALVTGARLAGRPFDRIEVAGSFADALLSLERSSVVQGVNRAQLTARDLPLDQIDVATWIRRGQGSLSAEVKDLPALLQAQGVEVSQLPEEVPEHEIVLEGDLADATLEIRSGRLTVADGNLAVVEGRLTAQDLSAIEEGRAPTLDLRLTTEADFPDLAALGQILGQPKAWAGSLRGTVSVAGTLPAVRGSAELEGSRLTAAGLRLGTFQLTADADGEKVIVRTFEGDAPWGSVTGDGTFLLESRELRDVQLTARVDDASLLTAEAGALPAALPPQLADLTGSFRLDATASGPLESPRASLELRGAGGLTEGPIFDVVEVDGSAAQGSFRLDRLLARGELGTFEAEGFLEEAPEAAPASYRGEIRRLSWRRQGDELALRQPAPISIQAGVLEIRELRLEGSAGGVTADVRRQDGVTSVEARLDSVEMQPFVGFLLPEGTRPGVLDGTLTADLGPAGLRLDTTGNLNGLVLRSYDEPLALAWDASLAQDLLTLRTLEAKAGSTLALKASGTAPLALLGPELLPPGAVDLEATLRPFALERLPLGSTGTEATLTAGGQLDLQGSWQDLHGELRLRGDGVRLDLPRAPGLLSDGTILAAVTLEAASGDIRITRLTAEFPQRLSAEASGTVGWDGDLAGLLEEPESFLEAPLSLEGQARLADARWLRPLVPDLRRLEGGVTADLRIAGTVQAPQPSGTAELQGISLRLDESGFSMEDLQGRLVLADGALELQDVTGDLGAAPFQASGTLGLAEGREVDVRIQGENLLLARFPTLRMRSDVDVRVGGTFDALTIEGELGLRNSRYTQEIDLLSMAAGSVTGTLAGDAPPTVETGGLQLFSFPDPPLANAKLDLAVTTVEPMQISSNLAEGAVRMDLRILGTGEVPLPQGDVYLEPTDLRLPSGTLRLDSGIIRFLEDNPFNPRLAVNGSARLRGYDVTAQITNTLAEPEVLLSSTPPLPNDDLLLLVLTGQRPQSGVNQQQAAAQAVALFLARDFITRWLSRGGDPNDTSWLDRFQIVRGRDVSEGGVETTEATFRVTSDEAKDGDALTNAYLVAEQDSFEDYNYGVRFVFRFQ